MVRTNIEIDNGYVQAVMDRYGVHTKTEAVDLALRHLAGQPMSRDEALSLRGCSCASTSTRSTLQRTSRQQQRSIAAAA